MSYLDPKFIIETLGLLGIFCIIFAESGLFFGFFLPGDTLLFTAGLLSSQGILPLDSLIILTSLSAILGDSVGYAFGRKIGPKIFNKEDSIIWNKSHIERSQKFFDTYGKKAIILSRFMPIIRTFTPILAGVGHMEYKSFVSYNILGGLAWVVSLTLFGFFFGKLIPNPDTYLLPVIVIIIVVSIMPAVREFPINRKRG